MPLPSPSRPGNQVLASLPEEDRQLLLTLSHAETPPPGHVVTARGAAANDIWFPDSGVIALLVTDKEGRAAQTGVVGPEGCVGLEAVFSDAPTSVEATIQISGHMSVIPSVALRTAWEARPCIRAALARVLVTLSAQSLQTVACNRLHSLEARCCRWLLMMRDRTGSNELPLTQEGLAVMLGSGRPRINGLLATLEQDGLVRRQRGRIRLVSRAGLERRACECYRLLR
jgi:CRP-like cAMP-binding protein